MQNFTRRAAQYAYSEQLSRRQPIQRKKPRATSGKFQGLDWATGLALVSGRAGTYVSNGKISLGDRVTRAGNAIIYKNSDRL